MEVDFSLSTVRFHVPLYLRAAFAATILYTAWCLFAAFRSLRDGGRFPPPRFPATLALLPIVGNVPVVWCSYARVARGMSVTGGGRSALSAGLAEALFHLLVAAVASSILAAVLLVLSSRNTRRPDRSAPESNGAHSRRRVAPEIIAAGVSGAGVVSVLLFARHLSQNLVFASAHGTAASVGVTLSAVIAAGLAAAVVVQHRDGASPSFQHRAMLIAALVVAGTSSVVIWRVMTAYQWIAMGAGAAP